MSIAIDERISARPFRLVEAAQPPDRSAVLARAIDATDRAERDVRWWAAPQFWGADSIERDLARDPRRAAVPRDGPRRPPQHAPAPPARTRPLRDL